MFPPMSLTRSRTPCPQPRCSLEGVDSSSIIRNTLAMEDKPLPPVFKDRGHRSTRQLGEQLSVLDSHSVVLILVHPVYSEADLGKGR